MGTAHRKCLTCGTPFKTTDFKNQKFCKHKCYAASRRIPDADYPRGYRNAYVPLGHPLAPPGSHQVRLHRLRLWESIGPGSHPCHGCGELVEWTVGIRTRPGGLIVDHIDRNPGNNDLSNLRPVCPKCSNANRRVTVTDDEDFTHNYQGFRIRGERRDCEWCAKSFVAWPDKRPGRGRFCSMSCARRNPRRTQIAA